MDRSNEHFPKGTSDKFYKWLEKISFYQRRNIYKIYFDKIGISNALDITVKEAGDFIKFLERIGNIIHHTQFNGIYHLRKS